MGSKRRKFADDGWAIWVNGDDTSSVYINDWLNPKGKSYVDLAVRLRGIMSSDTLNIYIPFRVNKDEITDISLLLDNETTLRAIFNATCIIDYKKNYCSSEIAYNGKTVDIIHISTLDFTLKHVSSGTLLTVDLISLHEYLANDEGYFIFRLPHKTLDNVFRAHADVKGVVKHFHELITSPVVSEKYGYSVRINEARLLPDEINRIGAFHRQKLKKSAISISIKDDYELNDSGCYRIRRFEPELYTNYAPKDFKCTNMITYQWKQNRETRLRGHFNYYFDISKSAISHWSLLIYMILLMVISVAGDALWTVLKYIFGWA